MNKIIRVLYGETNYKTNREVKQALAPEWAKEDVAHYVLGEKNAEYLEKLGAKDIRLIDSKNDMRPEDSLKRLHHFYNKSYLLEQSMRDYDEILFVDFDATCHKTPDDNMWKLLRNKGGKFNGEFQCPNVSYKNWVCISKGRGGVRDPLVDTMRKCLNTCVLYCSNKKWVDAHLAAFDTCPLNKGRYNFGGGEVVLMYYIDSTFGVMSIKEMIESFEPCIIDLHRGLSGGRWKEYTTEEKKPEDIYFKHY